MFLAHILLVARDHGRTELVVESQVQAAYLRQVGIRMAGYWRLGSALGVALCYLWDVVWMPDVIFQADQGRARSAANLQKFFCPLSLEDGYQATWQKLLA